MGIRLTTMLSDWWSGTRQTRLLMIGLDNAGKTTILYKLKLNEVVTTIPTIGFNVENITYKNLSMTIWDVGGQNKIQSLWRYYYQGTQGLIYVVDSSDKVRMDEVKESIQSVLADDSMRDVKVLLLANKQDLPQAMKPSEMVEILGLASIRQEWYIQSTNAITGDGLYEGLEWMKQALDKR